MNQYDEIPKIKVVLEEASAKINIPPPANINLKFDKFYLLGHYWKNLPIKNINWHHTQMARREVMASVNPNPAKLIFIISKRCVNKY